MIAMEKKVIAVIPAYNEEANIVSTVEDLRQNAPSVDYIIVNDGSKDKTRYICESNNYNIVSLPVNLGLAGAFQTGMKYAYRNNYDYAIQFDADGQHSAAYISALIKTAEEKQANIVIGSRFITRKKPFSARMIGSVLITGIIRLTTGEKILDPTSGMRLFDKTMIPSFANELDFGPEPDTVAYLLRQGAEVEEIEVEMRDRIAGESYLNFKKSVSYMLRMCISILFVQWFRGKK